MTVFLGSDHRGFHLKEALKAWLVREGHDVRDVGAFSYNVSDDFPDFAFAVADAVVQYTESRGIFICGSGVGGMIAANKVKGVYCCLGMNKDVVGHNRLHDDCNMLSLSSDHTSEEQAKQMIESFFTVVFEPQERFIRRLQKIQARER